MKFFNHFNAGNGYEYAKKCWINDVEFINSYYKKKI